MYTREFPSERYVELLTHYKSMHLKGIPEQGISPDKLYDGASLLRHLPAIRKLAMASNARSLLDYGSGKGIYYQLKDLKLPKGEKISSIESYLGVNEIRCYDPAVSKYSNLPSQKFDGVISTDALEHCPEEDVPWIVDEMFSHANKFVFANVASYPARKILPNGENAHATQRDSDWWRELLRSTSKIYPDLVYSFEISEVGRTLKTLFRKKMHVNIVTNS